MNLRLEKFRKKIKNICDGALITNEKNIKYLCGVDYTDGFLFITEKSAYLVCDFRYIEVANKNADKDFTVVMLTASRKIRLNEITEAEHAETIAFEDSYMTVCEYEKLKEELCGKNFVKLGKIISELRRSKDKREIEYMIKAQRTAEQAFLHILDFITTKRTERELANELDFEMRRLGADGSSFETIAVSGTAASMPHGVPRDIRLEKGFLTMDFGAIYKGYCSDMTRTVSIGKPTDKMKDIYNRVLEAQLRSVELYIKGGKCSDADAAARNIINRSYKGSFGHALGHGVGMDIHETPTVSPKSSLVFEQGDVVTCEPGIYLEGETGVRIEDMLIITETETVNITKTPKELIII